MSSQPDRRYSISYFSIYRIVGMFFFMVAATNLGVYSTQYGAFYILVNLCLLFVFLIIRPISFLQTVFHPVSALGIFFFGMIWVVSVISETGRQLQLPASSFTGLIIYIITAHISRITANQIDKIAIFFLFPLIFSTFVNIYEFSVAPDLFSSAPGRAAGFFENPNLSGSMLASLLGVWIAARKNSSIMFDLLVVVLVFAGIALTFSRGAVIEFVIIVGVVVWLRRGSVLKIRPALILVPILLGISLYIMGDWLSMQNLGSEAILRIDSLKEGKFDDESSLGRLEVAEWHLQLFFTNPIIGAGAFGSLAADTGWGPHNAFIAAAADFGILGLMTYLVILITGLRSARRIGWDDRRTHVLAVCIASLTVASFFSHNVFYGVHGQVIIGIMLGIASSADVSGRRLAKTRYE